MGRKAYGCVNSEGPQEEQEAGAAKEKKEDLGTKPGGNSLRKGPVMPRLSLKVEKRRVGSLSHFLVLPMKLTTW